MEPRLLRRGNLTSPANHATRRRTLQWSHAFSDVETQSVGNDARQLVALQWSHAFSDVETFANPLFICNNCILQWSHAFSDVETTGFPSSSRRSVPLQWSHAFSDVETQDERDEARAVATTSMEPRLLRRGNGVLGSGVETGGITSMEPRLLRRGNGFSASQAAFQNGLQWSHAFSDVETQAGGIGFVQAVELQWSHAFSDVETSSSRTAAPLPAHHFNGATPSQTWKPGGAFGAC